MPYTQVEFHANTQTHAMNKSDSLSGDSGIKHALNCHQDDFQSEQHFTILDIAVPIVLHKTTTYLTHVQLIELGHHAISLAKSVSHIISIL